MAPKKPTLVLIPGGWHTPPSYTHLTTSLTSTGHTLHIPTLPSTSSTRPPVADLTTDTAFIRSYIQDLISTGATLVVIMHSYGGQVGSNALTSLGVKAGEEAGVAHLIYMTAFAQVEGRSMIDLVEENGHGDLVPLAFDFDADGTVVSRDIKGLLISATTSRGEEEVEAYARGLVRWNGKCMYDRTEGAAWREIPTSYIVAKGDMTVPVSYQEGMVEGMRGEGREVDVYEVGGGHCPNFTATEEVVGAVEKILGKVVG